MRLKLLCAVISCTMIGVLVGAGAQVVLDSVSARYQGSSAFVTLGVAAFFLAAMVWTAYFESHRTEGKDKEK